MFLVIDIGIILLLIMGAIVGAKRGFFKQTVMFVGTIIVLILAYLLKNPVANIFYNIFPFIDLGGNENFILNILFYEAIAFFLVAAILFAILNILIKFTSIFEKILKLTIILGIPSKILGAIVGIMQYFVIIFLVIYFLNLPLFNLNLTNNSNISNIVLNKTPILSNVFKKELTTTEEIINLNTKYSNKFSEPYNLEALNIMLKNKIITVKSADTLVKTKKINLPGADSIINQYRKEKQ